MKLFNTAFLLTTLVAALGCESTAQPNQSVSKQAKVYSKSTQQEFFYTLKKQRIESDPKVQWKNFGPAMSGYNEEFWTHPTDTNVMFMGPDMHVSYGTWDNGKSWHSLKDSDGLGTDMMRVVDIEFSLQNPDFGIALDWGGVIYQTNDRGRNWQQTNIVGGAPKGRWWSQQKAFRLSELAVDPNNDNIWYVGAGDFWNVKANHKSKASPYGIPFKFADYGYILKSKDKGKTWQKITNGLPTDLDVAKIIVNPNNTQHIIMATSHGLMLSLDGGLSWKNSAKGLPNNLPRDLTSYYDRSSGDFVLYLAEQSVFKAKGKTVDTTGGIFKSIDGGQSWSNITGDLSLDLTAIHYPAEIDRYYRAIGYWFGVSKQQAKKTFKQLPKQTLPVFNRLVVNPLNKNEIYVSHNKKHDFTFGPGDVWRTLDGGKTWRLVTRHGAYWLAGKDNTYWKSRGNDVGTNLEFSHMQRYMDEKTEKSGNRMLAINAKGELFVGIDQQTLKSTNKGQSWVQIDDDETSPGSKKWIGRGGSNLPGRFMLHETGIPQRRLLSSGEHGLWQTTELGSWSDKSAVAIEQIEGQNSKHGAHTISTVAVHPNDPNTIYFLVYRQEHRGKLRRSTDGGKTWQNIATIFESDNKSYEDLAYQQSLIIDPVNPLNMYFCAIQKTYQEIGGGKKGNLTKGGFGIYRSTDGGYTWQLSNAGLPKEGKRTSVRRIAMHPDEPNVLYAALNEKGGLYKSTNRGVNWQKVDIPKVIESVNNIFIDRNTKAMLMSTGLRMGSYAAGGVWRSKDNGATWNKIFKAPYVWQAEISPVNSDLIVINVPAHKVSTDDKFKNPGIYLSTDSGATWTKINQGLGQPDKMVDVKPDPYNENVIWAAGWGSGWFVAYLNGEKSWLKK